MKPDTKKALVGLGIAAAVGSVIYYFVSKASAEERPTPPEPPPEGTGRIQGYVIDAGTSTTIPLAEIYVDDKLSATADMTGGFRTSYIGYGVHTLIIYANGYEVSSFEVLLEQSLLQQDFGLEPISEIEGFPDDIEVTDIVTQPITVRLGEVVNIGVYLLCAYPTPIPNTVTGTIAVDGTRLTETIEMRGVRNSSIWFQYIPQSAGVYTIRAKDKSATFEVMSDLVGIFYCPFGCVAPIQDGAWDSKLDLLGSWISLDEPTWYPDYPTGENCVLVPRFYGGGTSATGYVGDVYCPFCSEHLSVKRTPGDHSYMWALAEMLFNHIEQAHPEVRWNSPPTWLDLIGFDIFCQPKEWRPVCDYDVYVDGGHVSHNRFTPVAIGLGTHNIQITGLALSEGYPYRYVTFEYDVSVENQGDRVTLDVSSGAMSVVKWEDLWS